MSKNVLITGISGQIGSIASHTLAEQGHKVYGLLRSSARDVSNPIHPETTILSGDLCDLTSLVRVIDQCKPDWILHYGALSQVGTSFHQPHLTMQTNVCGSLNLLEAIRTQCPDAVGLFAGTSEMYGNNYSTSDGEVRYQDEQTTFCPVSQYGTSKLCMWWLVQNYRESFGLKVNSFIQSNAESEVRGKYFIPRKVSLYVAKTAKWLQSLPEGSSPDLSAEKHVSFKGKKHPKLACGNIEGVYRDWAYAPDCVDAHIKILENEAKKCYVIGRGETHSLSELMEVAFGEIGIRDWKSWIYKDPKFVRENELWYLCSNPSLIYKDLGWKSTTPFVAMIKRMVESDIKNQ